jgi:hypothetical protein
VFRSRYRRPPLTDPLNWTDYRWEAGPWRARPPRAAWSPVAGRRQGGLIALLLAGLAIVVGARLFASLQSKDGSWARRGLYAVLLLMIAGAFSRNRSARRW